MSAPKRWITHASFIRPLQRIAGWQEGSTGSSLLLSLSLPLSAILQSCNPAIAVRASRSLWRAPRRHAKSIRLTRSCRLKFSRLYLYSQRVRGSRTWRLVQTMRPPRRRDGWKRSGASAGASRDRRPPVRAAAARRGPATRPPAAARARRASYTSSSWYSEGPPRATSLVRRLRRTPSSRSRITSVTLTGSPFTGACRSRSPRREGRARRSLSWRSRLRSSPCRRPRSESPVHRR